ncbi:hypothetical protein Poly59_22750 [Rubripirellula reticaptiva]|uniref:Secreted protein n=1 Tax=Rubripirellula reticaptiva TaxID=2528013 RepID=A0A5C6F4D9_9BACT|nr:hypothetical protein Poly59_22750 [Rubripirellula reticaptiva]
MLKTMAHRILHRLLAIASAFIVLTVASSHLLCGDHDAHADEWQTASFTHGHAICECESCPCADREATLAVQYQSIDGVEFQPVAFATVWHCEQPLPNSIRSIRSLMPPDYATSHSWRVQRTTVILI